MKYKKNIISLDNKILFSCLGIAGVTTLFYVIYKIKNKTLEGLGLIIPEGPMDMAGTTTATVNMNSDMNLGISTTVTEEAKVETEMVDTANSAVTDAIVEQTAATTDALMIADDQFAQEERMREAIQTRAAGLEESIGSKLSDKVNRVASVVSTGADIAVTQAQNAATNAQNVLTYYNQADWNSKAIGMFSNFWKVGLLGFLVASGVGSWAISNIQVLIYRVMNFKSCFFWYFLEIIGWIIYLPIQFLVWLFCLQDFEKSCWRSLDAIDCSIYEYIGFYLFKHSDDVNEKCYSKVFTPFPNLSIPFNFDSIGNYMGNLDNITNNLTSQYGSPDEIAANVENAARDAEKAAESAKAAQIAVDTAMGVQIAAETALAVIP